MLRSLSDLLGYRIGAKDGDIGRVRDCFFDDERWAIRYFIVDTGKWLPGREVLLAPEAVASVGDKDRHVLTHLTKQQIEDSPAVETDKPVSRQQEIELHRYYAWTPYWGGFAEPYPVPAAVAVPHHGDDESGSEAAQGDAHLRSLKEVRNYHIRAADGEIGHVEDLIADDDKWAVRYLVADTRNWRPGRKVLLAPRWFKDFDWADRKAVTDVSRDDIENAPDFDPSEPIQREYEERLHDAYGRPRYWT